MKSRLAIILLAVFSCGFHGVDAQGGICRNLRNALGLGEDFVPDPRIKFMSASSQEILFRQGIQVDLDGKNILLSRDGNVYAVVKNSITARFVEVMELPKKGINPLNQRDLYVAAASDSMIETSKVTVNGQVTKISSSPLSGTVNNFALNFLMKHENSLEGAPVAIVISDSIISTFDLSDGKQLSTQSTGQIVDVTITSAQHELSGGAFIYTRPLILVAGQDGVRAVDVEYHELKSVSKVAIDGGVRNLEVSSYQRNSDDGLSVYTNPLVFVQGKSTLYSMDYTGGNLKILDRRDFGKEITSISLGAVETGTGGILVSKRKVVQVKLSDGASYQYFVNDGNFGID